MHISFTNVLRLAAITGLGLLSTASHAQVISDLFNTGVNSGGAKLLPANTSTVDLHYTQIATNVASTSVFVEQSPNGAWVTAADSNYIAPDGSDGSTINGGFYTLTYRTSFTLPANANLASVNIAGGWSTDDSGQNIFINGFATGITSSGFGGFTSFVIPTGHYNVGVNTLDFTWADNGGPGGLNARYTTKSFTTTPSGTPEPGSFALLAGLSICGSFMAAKRRRK